MAPGKSFLACQVACMILNIRLESSWIRCPVYNRFRDEFHQLSPARVRGASKETRLEGRDIKSVGPCLS